MSWSFVHALLAVLKAGMYCEFSTCGSLLSRRWHRLKGLLGGCWVAPPPHAHFPASRALRVSLPPSTPEPPPHAFIHLQIWGVSEFPASGEQSGPWVRCWVKERPLISALMFLSSQW